MKKLTIICSICMLAFTSMAVANETKNDGKKTSSVLPSAENEGAGVSQWVDSVYSSMQLESYGLKREIFFYACKGYEYLISQRKLKKSSLLTICDYSQSSSSKRLYVLDMQSGKVLYNTYVSHGKNSGNEYATDFSNKTDSHKSSLGFMVTSATYMGKAGYSLIFEGLEKGINNNVKARNIVMHGSNYVNENRLDAGNTLGRSFGCPAVSYAKHKKIINAIKGGSCFFAYAEDSWYAATSKILNAHFEWPSALPQAAPAAPAEDVAATSGNTEAFLPVYIK